MTTTLEQRTMVVTPANWVPGPKQGHWTYNHYAALPDDGHRYEIVDGVLYMTPAPNIIHQKVALRIVRYLAAQVEDTGLGEVFIAPVDVELARGTVFQPGVIVVLNNGRANITPTRIVGAPDLVVEVASPATAGFDRREKQDAYARAALPEYWIVDPAAHTVEVLSLEGGTYHSHGVFSGQDTLPSQVVPTIVTVPVEKFFL